MKLSICVIAYNEEKNLSYLLDCIKKQRLSKNHIHELFIISDGSTDCTSHILEKFRMMKTRLIRKIHQKRQGKYKRINEFISEATGEILVVASADILLENNALENLTCKFENENYNVATARAISVRENHGFFDKLNEIYWGIHHEICKISPKGSSLIAFKKKEMVLSKTSVDEEEIISCFISGIHYCPDAKFHIKSPQNIKETMQQTIRYHSGHRFLQKRKGYTSPSIQFITCVRGAWNYLKNNKQNALFFLFFLFIQIIGRIIGELKFINRNEEILWKTAPSTKLLIK